MARQKHRSQLDSFNTINITPLLDTAFMLLIVFLISAPLLEYGVDVSPPELNADTMNVNEKSKVVQLNNKGEMIFEKTVVNAKQLLDQLRVLDKKNPIFLRADGLRQYKEVMAVMKIIRDSGFKNVSLITQAEDK
jgi:biopolymer transport protein ExbD